MASAGWNDRQRRVHTGGQGINFAQPSKRSYVDILDSRVPYKGGYREERHDNQRKVEEMKQVFWEGSSEGQKWLNKCAVGTLRRFDKVSRVNRELQNRGIAFKASYLGDKFILWRFEDEQTCLSFIKNRSAWEDNFSSMSQWRATTVAKMKPVWINLLGVPLRLHVQRKSRLKIRGGVFWLTVEEEGAPANVLWVEDFLDLAEGVSMSDLREPPISDFERQSPTPISDFERQSHGVGGDNRGWQMVSQDRAKAKQVGSYGVASGSQINVRDKRKLSQLDSRKGVSNDFLKKDKDLTGGGKPVTKQTKKGLKMGRSGGVHGNITKSTQLMMKRGLLKASLTSKSHMRQGRKGERGAEEEAQAGKGEEIGHMQSETGDPAEDGHQVLQENFAIEENLVFETEEDDLEWNLDKEICKIIEIGCALGCDFSGKENFIGEELMRREKEDQRRFRESNE
ncbi:hypothetical protein LWI29_004878 [Acer saccharum]|uniref:DUF4283 domain-containing protein n=1 Tax=Acer saccharum TaxID=4024 RepID=A0AA39T2Q2_ACESA|nr:hypothetical protein LWI29_004878 [Acer saccharum]